MKTTEILNTKINHDLTVSDALTLIDAKLQERTFFQICTTNPEFIVDARHDSEFRDIINSSYLSLPDGSGVVYALEYLSRVEKLKRDFLFPARSFWAGISLITKVGDLNSYPPIYGAELTHHLLSLADKKGYTVGLIGGWPKDKFGRPLKGDYNIAKEAREKLNSNYPNLKIVFADSNLFAGSDHDEESTKKITSELKEQGEAHIDMLFVGFGHIKQEKWINRMSSRLPISMAIGIGGTIDDIAGYTSTPNDFYSKNNLRWLHRLIHQPWRFKRILKATLSFPFIVFIDTLKH